MRPQQTLTRLDRACGFLLKVRPAAVAVILKRVLKIKRRVLETKEGSFWVDPASVIGQQLLRNGVFTPEIVSQLRLLIPPGGILIDLGAHEGYFTVIGAKLAGPDGTVIAIEPQDRLLGVIERNLALNCITNVVIEHAAVSDSRGKATLMLSPDINTGSSGLAPTLSYPVPTQETEIRTLSDVVSKFRIEHVDCLKVDIEGAEAEAILGSPSLFSGHRVRALLLELHPRQLSARGHSEAEIATFLISNGYNKRVDRGVQIWTVN